MWDTIEELCRPQPTYTTYWLGLAFVAVIACPMSRRSRDIRGQSYDVDHGRQCSRAITTKLPGLLQRLTAEEWWQCFCQLIRFRWSTPKCWRLSVNNAHKTLCILYQWGKFGGHVIGMFATVKQLSSQMPQKPVVKTNLSLLVRHH